MIQWLFIFEWTIPLILLREPKRTTQSFNVWEFKLSTAPHLIPQHYVMLRASYTPLTPRCKPLPTGKLQLNHTEICCRASRWTEFCSCLSKWQSLLMWKPFFIRSTPSSTSAFQNINYPLTLLRRTPAAICSYSGFCSNLSIPPPLYLFNSEAAFHCGHSTKAPSQLN